MFGWGKLNLSVSNDVINQVMKVVSLLSLCGLCIIGSFVLSVVDE